jgi:adenosine deaminase/adenosine deaminase CECR1
VSYPSDKLFFESFESLVQPLWDIWRRFIGTKNRAMENVSYIETEFSTIPSNINTSDLGFNTQLRLLANNRNEKRVKAS